MNPTIVELKATLFATDDGGIAADAINALTKRAKKGNHEAKSVLAEYVGTGRVPWMRTHSCACLATTIAPTDVEFAEVFERGLSDELTRYWSILGYITIQGRGAYQALMTVAADETIPIEDRAYAIKRLASFSKRQFDRQLPSDPGEWKASDLRLDELDAWARAGYPDGEGYPTPNRHPALDQPASDLEVIVSRLDKKLAKIRREHQDPTAPTDWLAIADPKDIEDIKARWMLPSLYLDFLTRFSPVHVLLEIRGSGDELLLFGAGELIEGQAGYAFNPVVQEPIEDWPTSFLVIANRGGDPFVLDLSRSSGEDAPVLTARHGTGRWDFHDAAGSFAEFLESMVKRII